MENVPNATIFRYKSTDFNYEVKNNVDESKFDTILKQKWNHAEEHGIHRYKLRIKEWKILEGTYRFLAQLNLDRASNRRTPEDISSMSQPFDPNRFNFTMLPAKEIFFDIGDGSGNDVIAANVSPMEWGHSLFLPDRLKCLQQKVTKSSLVTAIDLMLLSHSPYFRLIFNSLCAHASVNHLHWHLYYLKHQMLLEDIKLEEIKAPLFALKDYPAKGFCIKLSSFPDRDIRSFGTCAFCVINHLQENNIAHNVFITRAKTDPAQPTYNDIRVYIWARKSSTGVKNTRLFFLAVSELFGHLSVRSEDEYRNLTEEKVAQLLADATLDVFTKIKESIKDAIDKNIMQE